MIFNTNLNEVPQQAESRVFIRFQDCDPLKHLNNARYFEYFFNTRQDHVAGIYKFDYEYMFNQLKTSWVIYQHQIGYVRPALMSEWVRIITRIIFHDDDTLVTEHIMTDDKRKQLKTVLWTTSKHVNIATGKRTPHHKELNDYLAAVTIPDIDFENLDFNKRIHQIKRELINA